jgi:hypothetical protein
VETMTDKECFEICLEAIAGELYRSHQHREVLNEVGAPTLAKCMAWKRLREVKQARAWLLKHAPDQRTPLP